MTVEIHSPFPDYALPRAWGWLEKVRNRVADDYGPKTVDQWVDQEIGAEGKTWGVWRDGELGGMLSFRQLSPWLGVGHCTFRKDFWGRATTRPAVEQALKEIFDSGIGKLTFAVFSDNAAIRSLLSEFGASSEGTLRGHTMRQGKPVDMTMLAIFADKFKEKFDASSSATIHHGGDRGGVLNPGVDLRRQTEDHHDRHLGHTIA